MIFKRKAPKQTNPQRVWKKKFAFLPVCVGINNDGDKTYAFWQHYEQEYHSDNCAAPSWITTNRLPGSESSYKYSRFIRYWYD